MKDKLSLEKLLECLRGWAMDGTIDNWREIDEQAYEQIKSRLSPVPEERRRKLVADNHYLWKHRFMREDDVLLLLQALDNLREGKEG